MEMYRLIMPLGIAAYVCLFLAAVSGLLIFRYHIRWVGVKTHMYLGLSSLVLGALHAGLVIYLNR